MNKEIRLHQFQNTKKKVLKKYPGAKHEFNPNGGYCIRQNGKNNRGFALDIENSTVQDYVNPIGEVEDAIEW